MQSRHSAFFYPYSFNFWFSSEHIDELGKQLDFLIHVPPDKKILLWSIELVDQDVLRHVINFVGKNKITERTFWLLQPSHQYPPDLLSSIGENLFLIDNDLLLLNLYLNECATSIANQQWNPDTGRFLFPTGKPDRPNRIQLLYKFYINGLLDHCDWSLFVDNQTRAQSKKLLPELDHVEFDRFILCHNRNLDNIEIYHCIPYSNHSSGYPFDGSLYQRSSFRVISETMMMDKPIISEKTWITIANRMPFVMAGYSNNLKYLKDSGYHTFENYLPVPDYDQIQNTENRFEAILENTKFWLGNIHNQKDQIEKDVEHNCQLLNENIGKNLQRAKNLAIALGEPERSIYSLIPLSVEQQKWTIFYYNIKDSTWPDCLLEQDFKKLPLQIQKECIEQFNYLPKKNH